MMMVRMVIMIVMYESGVPLPGADSNRLKRCIRKTDYVFSSSGKHITKTKPTQRIDVILLYGNW